jgi:hypothetical protein
MDTDDGNQGRSTHIGNEPRQRAAAFIGKAVQRRMIWVEYEGLARMAQNDRIKRPNARSNVVLTAFLA